MVAVRCAAAAGELEVTVGGVAERLPAGGGTVRVPAPDLWWPHTHGEPVLHGLQVRSKAGEAQRNVGFRQLTHADNVELDGLDLHVNGVPVFVRGAVWTPTPPGDVRATLERARGAGLNLIRIVGTMVYEDAEFHDACDELGLFVWQDLLFANMDYPFSDEGFAALAEKEVSQALHEVAGRPSLAVVCGNSEIEQQVAMLGLPPELGRDPFFLSKIPALIRSAQLDAAYVPSAPTGGAFPFRTGQGVANYFGVGAYLRPLEDVRRSAVRFASECLAFANVPDGDPSDRAAGVMRDVGAAWDFADVRDHYLQALHGITSTDERYWEHARQITGELMAAVFGEWRRAASTCTGGILLWLRDLAPGAGWGVLDSEGKPKAVWYHLRDALAPVAVWFVDEGLNGLVVHVANDTAKAVQATLRLALYRDERLLLEEVRTPLVLNPHSAFERDIEELLGRFVDVTYSYRFGDAQQDTVVASLHGDQKVLSQAFFRVDCRPQSTSWTADELGLEALSQGVDEHALRLTLSSTRVVRRVRLKAERSEPDTDSFDLEPGRPRTVALLRRAGAAPSVVEVSALNLAEPLLVQVRDRACALFGDRRRSCVCDTPCARGRRSSSRVLLIPPFGWDEIASHRSRREWAIHLVENGYDVMRVDLPGTGDSAGDLDSPNRWRSWQDAVAGAAHWLRVEANVERVSVIGISLGGYLALSSVASGAAEEGVLWATPATGKRYLREFQAFGALEARRIQEAGGPPPDARSPVEAGGFVIHDDLAGAITDVVVGQTTLPAGARVLILDRDGTGLGSSVSGNWRVEA